MGARYAVWGTLDSLNDTGILPKNDHYHRAFALFCGFWIIRRGKDGKMALVPTLMNGEPLRYRLHRLENASFSLVLNFDREGDAVTAGCGKTNSISSELMNEHRWISCDACHPTGRPVAWTRRCSRRRGSALRHLSRSRKSAPAENPNLTSGRNDRQMRAGALHHLSSVEHAFSEALLSRPFVARLVDAIAASAGLSQFMLSEGAL